eukprot:gene27785-10276_t
MCAAGLAHSPTMLRLLECEQHVADLNTAFDDDTDWWQLLLLVLVEQHTGKQNSQSRKHDFQLRLQSKKKSSFWDPMLRTVDDGGSAPSGSTGYTCAFMWGDAEHKMLAHTSLDMQVTIEGLIAVHDTEWILTAFDKALFDNLTKDDYTHAKCFATTRGVDFNVNVGAAAASSTTTADTAPTTMSVCSPFFDLLNHKPSLEANAQFQVAVQSDSGGVAASTNGDGSKSGRSIQVSATKNIPAGQQIFVSYIANSISSGKDDWYLLHRYGFCSSDGENASPPPHPQPNWQYIVDKAA